MYFSKALADAPFDFLVTQCRKAQFEATDWLFECRNLMEDFFFGLVWCIAFWYLKKILKIIHDVYSLFSLVFHRGGVDLFWDLADLELTDVLDGWLSRWLWVTRAGGWTKIDWKGGLYDKKSMKIHFWLWRLWHSSEHFGIWRVEWRVEWVFCGKIRCSVSLVANIAFPNFPSTVPVFSAV